MNSPPKICDNRSVGVIPIRRDGRIAMFRRGAFPPGIAPVAGHCDGDSPLTTAGKELGEEIGLRATAFLPRLESVRLSNVCRRQGGDHHTWWVYVAEVDGELDADHNLREAKQPNWYAAAEIQELTDRTVGYATGKLGRDEWLADPRLEPVWVILLDQAGFASARGEQAAVVRLAGESP